MSNNAVARKPSEDINGWMRNYLAQKLNVTPDKIDTKESFDTFGLDSADAVRMIGDLEDYLGRRLSPSLAYKYPTIDAMSKYLADGKS